MAAVRDGMSIAEVVRVFGVSRGSVATWRTRWSEGGASGLDSGRPGRRAGEHTKLSPSEAEALAGAILDHSPEDLDLGGKLWTRRKVTALAERLFGATFTDQVITDRAQMEYAVRSFFHRVQKVPDRVLGYFQAPHTKYVNSAARS